MRCQSRTSGKTSLVQMRLSSIRNVKRTKTQSTAKARNPRGVTDQREYVPCYGIREKVPTVYSLWKGGVSIGGRKVDRNGE